MAHRASRRFHLSDPIAGEISLEPRELLTELPGSLIIRQWSGNLNGPTTFVSDKKDWIYVGELDGTIQRVSTADGRSEFLLKLPAENVDSREIGRAHV